MVDEARASTGLKPTAWIVNIARGARLSTPNALVHALREGSIGGAALDVTDPEPLPPDHPLWTLPNALITPHVANPESGLYRAYSPITSRTNVTRILLPAKPLLAVMCYALIVDGPTSGLAVVGRRCIMAVIFAGHTARHPHPDRRTVSRPGSGNPPTACYKHLVGCLRRHRTPADDVADPQIRYLRPGLLRGALRPSAR